MDLGLKLALQNLEECEIERNWTYTLCRNYIGQTKSMNISNNMDGNQPYYIVMVKRFIQYISTRSALSFNTDSPVTQLQIIMAYTQLYYII